MVRGSLASGRWGFKDKAKNRVDDLQCMFSDLQAALKDGRSGDAAVIEEQVHQMLREWKAELNDASPASSLIGSSHSSDISSEIFRLLQLAEEQDDATSKLDEVNAKIDPVAAPEHSSVEGIHGGHGFALALALALAHQEKNCLIQDVLEQGTDQYQNTFDAESHHVVLNSPEGTTNLEYQQFTLNQESPSNQYLGFNAIGQHGGNGMPHISDLLPTMCPPASAFLKPKCALWDCPRPAQASEWCQDYCSRFHADLAFNECPPGMPPVLRPGGIDLKDGPLFAALSSKTQGKNVGIPECEGAATGKSPWNAPDLFDLSVLEGETLREWLFFDKPRRAFESGNRKQRSLPDYKGHRGWHESRKYLLKEFGGLKRSYYMDPQPLDYLEWHLYEYEINNYDACALYRLELKLVDAKKSSKTKMTGDSLVDLQQQMRRLNAENYRDNKRNVKGRAEVSSESRRNMKLAKDIVHPELDAQNVHMLQTTRQAPVNENPAYESSLLPDVSVGREVRQL